MCVCVCTLHVVCVRRDMQCVFYVTLHQMHHHLPPTHTCVRVCKQTHLLDGDGRQTIDKDRHAYG